LGGRLDHARRDPPRPRQAGSELLADRGWGKAAVYEPQGGDPLDLSDMEAAAEEFRARILRLADEPSDRRSYARRSPRGLM